VLTQAAWQRDVAARAAGAGIAGHASAALNEEPALDPNASRGIALVIPVSTSTRTGAWTASDHTTIQNYSRATIYPAFCGWVPAFVLGSAAGKDFLGAGRSGRANTACSAALSTAFNESEPLLPG
jgi:hypothetical protein